MTSDQDKARSWRPRWSIRRLLIVVTLVCAYLACWGPTKKYGPSAVEDVHSYSGFEGLGLERSDAIAPLVDTVHLLLGMIREGSSASGFGDESIGRLKAGSPKRKQRSLALSATGAPLDLTCLVSVTMKYLWLSIRFHVTLLA